MSKKRHPKYKSVQSISTPKPHELPSLVSVISPSHSDSSDIVDQKLKLILGLIWTLILHYSISMPVWDDYDDYPITGHSDLTPKQRLLAWIQNKIPDRPITNFTSDWNDGKAIGALVDAIAPGMYL